MVKRYNGIEADTEGVYVMFEDYERLLARPYRLRRLELKEGREHLTVTNEFQSDKYPWCPAGFVPLKVTDPMATTLLWAYADRRKSVDAEFTRDLNDALLAAAADDSREK